MTIAILSSLLMSLETKKLIMKIISVKSHTFYQSSSLLIVQFMKHNLPSDAFLNDEYLEIALHVDLNVQYRVLCVFNTYVYRAACLSLF